MMELTIVNSVWRGSLDMHVDLHAFESRIEDAMLGEIKSVKHQQKQPEQLVIKFNDGSTMLMFKTGKFRIMGKVDELSAHCNVLLVTSLLHAYPEVQLQTMTVVYAYPYRILLDKLSLLIKCHYDLENFPAVQITKYKPIHVNVFASGKVIICGIKDLHDAKNIETELDNIIMCTFLIN